MLRLKNKYRDKAALIIFGGPSIIENRYDLRCLNLSDNIIFLESKALTPLLLESGIKPHYFLLPFAEKSKDNTLQNYIYRALMGKVDVLPLIREDYHDFYYDIKRNFQRYFEVWSPAKGPHKAVKWRAGQYLKNSPYDLLPRLPDMSVITNRQSFGAHFPNSGLSNEIYYYENLDGPGLDENTDYFAVIERGGRLQLPPFNYNNSAAIAVYRLLNFMGFNRVYFLGMDMSMLGSMEYSAHYTYRSIWHFYWYLYRARPAFDPRIKWGFPMYRRPQNNFDEQKSIFEMGKLEYVRIYDPWKYAAPLDYVKTISFADYIKQRA